MNTQPQPFETILAVCIDEVLRGQSSVGECLARYPEHADELRVELHVGLLAARLKKVEMAPAAVDDLEARLRAEMAAAPPLRVVSAPRGPRVPLAVSRLAAAVVIVLVLALGSGAGLVAASADDLPGDPLYGIKRLWEAIVLALSPLTGSLDDLLLSLAETRLAEAEALAAQSRLTDTALADLYRAAASVILAADADSQAKVIDFLTDAQDQLRALHPPPDAEVVYGALLDLTSPRLEDGVLQSPPSIDPPLALPTRVLVTGTPVTTATYTATVSLTPSPTPTLSVTPSPTLTATLTRTPTPSRTPTFTPTVSATPTPTATVTATWTPLPLPLLPPATGSTAEPPLPQPQPTSVPPEMLTDDEVRRIRETERAVYLTQTAGPPTTPSPAP